MSRRAVFAVGAAALLIFGACAQEEEPAAEETPAPPTEVSVDLQEWSVTPDPTSAPADGVSFTIENTGSIEHELVVIKTELAPDELPTAEAEVEEDAPDLEVSGKIEAVDAGSSDSDTFQLDAGSYVLICNIPAHYEQGMRAAFDVR